MGWWRYKTRSGIKSLLKDIQYDAVVAVVLGLDDGFDEDGERYTGSG